MNVNIGIEIGNVFIVPSSNNQMIGYAWASAPSPSLIVSALVQVSVSAIPVSGSSSALPPTVSNDRNVSVLAVGTNVNSDTFIPSIAGIRNISINEVIANISVSGLSPIVTNAQGASVLAVVASESGNGIIPVVSVIRNPTVTTVITNTTASTGIPTVSAGSGTTATLVSDSFNRANSTTTLGTTDSYNGGTPQTWLTKSGNWGVLNNQAYLVTDNGKVDPKLAYFDVGQSDVSITVTIPVVNDNFSCAFRLDTTANTGIIVHTGTIKLQSFSGESYTTIADSGIWAVSGDVVKVTIQGTSITVFRNGTQILTGTSSINQTFTKHGLGNYQKSGATGTAGMWDSFSIETL